MCKIVVIGGGASGMLASGVLAEKGHDVTLIEKNEKLGKKLYITGKGRCNITNDCSPAEFLENVVTNSKFMTSAIYLFPPSAMIDFLENEGLSVSVERGNRVFPSSNKSNDVIKILKQKCDNFGVKIQLNTPVLSVSKKENVFFVKTENDTFVADKLIIATGGKSYPLTGSTGDGYKFAKIFGHSVTEIYPSLCPIILKNDVITELEGLSLKNVRASVSDDKKIFASEFGEMIFTSNGVSGPIVLTLSAKINKIIAERKNLYLVIDLKPALTTEQLDARVLKDFNLNINKCLKNALDDLLPRKLIPIFINLLGIDPNTKINSISAENRNKIVFLLKNLTFNVLSLEKIDMAVITSGGINTKEINPKTMESKIVPGLYFIGEVIDVDALTGGFNLQIAFSTAFAASRAIG